MAVGAGFGFGGEGEACWPSAMPPVETKVRIISRTIRIIECEMERSAPYLLRGFIDLGEVLISQIGVPTNGGASRYKMQLHAGGRLSPEPTAKTTTAESTPAATKGVEALSAQ